ncbi:MAG: penicillin-binding transpeptidase domain-containing protein [Clostridia bacterium]
MSNKSFILRILSIVVVVVLFIFLCVYELYDLQIVHGEEYREDADKSLSGNTTLYAARGEIIDRNGEKLISNTMAFSLRFNKSLWNSDTQNKIITDLIEILDEYDLEYTSTFPMELTNGRYVFTSSTDKLMSFLTSKKASDDVDTENEIIEFLAERYSITEYMTSQDLLDVISVRYEMEQQNFSTFNSFAFAENVNIEVVTYIREMSDYFVGVEIDETPVREYQTDYAAHILGRVGPIFAEEYAELKSQGYSLNATIGKDGMEKVLETYLKATNGKKANDLVIKDEVVAKGTSVDPIPGNNAVLTLDLELQAVVEESLATTFASIQQNGIDYNKAGYDIEGGAAVVIDVNTGEILALASYPTYSLKTFNADYSELLSDTLKPMFNRATNGTYAPGSTYKMVTALAGLEEGVITSSTIIQDKGKYTYYSDYQPACWIYNDYGSTHGYINVAGAIKYSCNYFFYETGRLVTGATMEEYAAMLGLGQSTGLELSEKIGNIAGPTSRDAKGNTWYPGDTLAAAIGQSDHLFTPVQLANYIATLANGGTLNQAHLLKAVYSYDYSELIFENNPEPIQVLDVDPANIETILQGMSDVVNEGGTAASVFRDYPIAVAGKTGSAQVGSGSATGVFVSFAPFDEPEIAVCVIGEHAGTGGNVAPVVRDIYDQYFGLNEVSEEDEVLEGEEVSDIIVTITE